ncbi:hypothetical protein [Methylotenera versatilis]|uniref:hypothetical protein n=1 Tax=Methylotenera versatilis TaxID=1055487 RepID=UPI0006480595|nr:hypothetical protein [Methylotenera versatilis]
MFLYIFAAGLLADAHHQSNEGLYFFGYFLCGFAFLMSIASFVGAMKLKNINDKREQDKSIAARLKLSVKP